MVVPAMTTEEINLTLLDASVQYIKKQITLETLTLLAAKIHCFMGLRGEKSVEIDDLIAQITQLTHQQKTDLFFDSTLLKSAV